MLAKLGIQELGLFVKVFRKPGEGCAFYSSKIDLVPEVSDPREWASGFGPRSWELRAVGVQGFWGCKV